MNTKVTPKDFFIWIGAMVALYGSAVALIALLFEYINHAFPDPLAFYTDPFSDPIRFAMASLIVLVPVAIVLMGLIRKDIGRMPDKADLWVRRWALVLTVFIAGATVVGDLITLINYFLGGDLTTRFILKVVVVLLVAGAIFLHFLSDLRGYWLANPARARMVGYGAGLAVIVAIIAGFFIIGTPGQVRLMRFDSQKVNDLQSIQWQLVDFWQRKQVLPASMEELDDPLSGWKKPRDPQTGEPYRYERTSNTSFKLCATFNAASTRPETSEAVPVRAYGTIDGSFEHGAGNVCFDRTIDPERYPPYSKPIM
jgi:hypothetical protein